jgi:RHS repeat-associated protein
MIAIFGMDGVQVLRSRPEAPGALVKATIPLPGGETAVYNASGLNFIRHKDWLGSSRLATTWTHGVYAKEAYAPFGESYNEAGTPDRSFTGQDQDTVPGVYDYLFRKYDPAAGRWLSPDPSGWKAVSQDNPQSLNRYAYVTNRPMDHVDPNGEDTCYVDVQGDVSDQITQCIDQGAIQAEEQWVPDASYAGPAPTVDQYNAYRNSPDYLSWMDPTIFYYDSGAPDSADAPSNGTNFYYIPGEPYAVCSAAALYAELQDIKTLTDAKNNELSKTYGTALALLGPGSAFKYGMGGSITGAGLVQTVLAGVAAKTYFVTFPSWLSGMSQAEQNFKANMQTCENGG